MHRAWLCHGLAFNEVSSIHQETQGKLCLRTTLLSEFGCITIASSFREKRLCLKTEVSQLRICRTVSD
jgi:hypothetical protein